MSWWYQPLLPAAALEEQQGGGGTTHQATAVLIQESNLVNNGQNNQLGNINLTFLNEGKFGAGLNFLNNLLLETVFTANFRGGLFHREVLNFDNKINILEKSSNAISDKPLLEGVFNTLTNSQNNIATNINFSSLYNTKSDSSLSLPGTSLLDHRLQTNYFGGLIHDVNLILRDQFINLTNANISLNSISSLFAKFLSTPISQLNITNTVNLVSLFNNLFNSRITINNTIDLVNVFNSLILSEIISDIRINLFTQFNQLNNATIGHGSLINLISPFLTINTGGVSLTDNTNLHAKFANIGNSSLQLNSLINLQNVFTTVNIGSSATAAFSQLSTLFQALQTANLSIDARHNLTQLLGLIANGDIAGQQLADAILFIQTALLLNGAVNQIGLSNLTNKTALFDLAGLNFTDTIQLTHPFQTNYIGRNTILANQQLSSSFETLPNGRLTIEAIASKLTEFILLSDGSLAAADQAEANLFTQFFQSAIANLTINDTVNLTNQINIINNATNNVADTVLLTSPTILKFEPVLNILAETNSNIRNDLRQLANSQIVINDTVTISSPFIIGPLAAVTINNNLLLTWPSNLLGDGSTTAAAEATAILLTVANLLANSTLNIGGLALNYSDFQTTKLAQLTQIADTNLTVSNIILPFSAVNQNGVFNSRIDYRLDNLAGLLLGGRLNLSKNFELISNNLLSLGGKTDFINQFTTLNDGRLSISAATNLTDLLELVLNGTVTSPQVIAQIYELIWYISKNKEFTSYLKKNVDLTRYITKIKEF